MTMRIGVLLTGLMVAVGLQFPAAALSQDIDFSDDASRWARDGDCDDPRFTGEGSSIFLSPLDLMHDATDCSAAIDAGTVALTQDRSFDASPATPDTNAAGIDFGDDSGTWANDGECDDPRFGGVLDSHLRADASDCRTAFAAGEVTFEAGTDAEPETVVVGELDFGNDTGEWARDGECDDPRFVGAGAGVALDDHIMADASDCAAAYKDGTVFLAEDIEFGDNSGQWAHDGECDDPRFGGPLGNHLFADATDCRAALASGEVTMVRNIVPPTYPIVLDGIDFGDDSAEYSWDGECDDPRFKGTGVGVALDDHLMGDASDCAAAYLANAVVFTGG